MKKVLLTLTMLFSCFCYAMAQETICNDGIDNDGDGFVDCYDSDCAGSVECANFFIGGVNAECQARPTEFPEFKMELAWQSQVRTSSNLSRPAIGDLDGDGIPEVVTSNERVYTITILDGRTGSTKRTVTTRYGGINYEPYREVSIANLDGGNCVTIFHPLKRQGRNEFSLAAFDCNLNLLWRVPIRGKPGNIGIADFDGDGLVEIYVRDEIFDAHTGRRIVRSTAANWEHINSGPVAVDILNDNECANCSGLELIVGGTIFSVNLGSRGTDAGSLNVERQMSQYHVKFATNWNENRSTTSVADYNLDGYLDVITTGATGSETGPTSVFFWDVRNNQVRTYSEPNPAERWHLGTGRLNIADIDGDGHLNVTYCSGNYLYALDENFNLKWRSNITETSSGTTGTTVFDFNGDGKYEIVYRDERNLYIVNGTDGSFYRTIPCGSMTTTEYPIVADVTGNGESEICVTCHIHDHENAGLGGVSWDNGHIRLFKAGDGERWVPSRKLWNQHAYFNVNVNENLTIPRNQQRHHIVFPNADCVDGPHRPLNTFLNQSPYLDSNGCPVYGAPNFTFEGPVEVDSPECPDKNVTIRFSIKNDGDADVNGNVPLTLYEGSPFSDGVRITTVNLDMDGLRQNTTKNFEVLFTALASKNFILYLVINDAGTGGIPLELPNSPITECDYDNNITSVDVYSRPLTLRLDDFLDNRKCLDSKPDNGEGMVSVRKNGADVSGDFNFSWVLEGATTPSSTDAHATGLSEGVYTVTASHKLEECGVEPLEVELERQYPTEAPPTLAMQPKTNCQVNNGSLTATPPTGRSIEDVSFEWMLESDFAANGNDAEVIRIGEAASSLNSLAYRVRMTNIINGCSSMAYETVDDVTSTPVVSAQVLQHIESCNDLEAGRVSANVNGNTTGYTFRWYSGQEVKSVPDHTGNEFHDLAAGHYTVVAVHEASNCASLPVSVEVLNNTTFPEIEFHSIAPQTSCDNTAPNGSISATADGTASGYLFQWFRGQNTVTPVPGGNNVTTISNLRGNRYFTVRVTNINNHCESDSSIYLPETITYPANPTVSTSPQTVCNPANGQASATVSGQTAGYNFYWYDGNAVRTNADAQGAAYNQIWHGEYTVVAEDDVTKCKSEAVTAVVDNQIPAFTISIGSGTGDDCIYNNVITTASVPGNANGYTYQWYLGQEPVHEDRLIHDQGNVVDNIDPGHLTVVVTNLDNMCTGSHTRFFGATDFTPLLNANASDFDNCIQPNGSVSGVVVDINDVPFGNQEEYNFYLFEGNSTGYPQNAFHTVTNNSAGYLVDNLTPGEYTLLAIQNFGNECKSVPETFVINDNGHTPVVGITEDQPNINCVNVNGSLSAVITEGQADVNYNFFWYDQAMPITAGTQASSQNQTYANLAGGSYSVIAIHQTTGCSDTATIALGEFLEYPVVTLDGSITNYTCQNNGFATVQVSPGTVSDYGYFWHAGAYDVENRPQQSSDNFVEIQSEAIYFVEAVHLATGCISEDVLEVRVSDRRTNPVIPEPNSSPSEICNGQILVAGDASLSLDPNVYQINWYANGQTTAFASDQPNVSGLNHNQVYNVEVIERNGHNDNRCRTTRAFAIGMEDFTPIVDYSASPVLRCASPFDGSAMVIVENSADYNYAWSLGGVNITADSDNPRRISQRDEGNYSVRVTSNTHSTCFVSLPIAVLSRKREVNVSVDQIKPMTNCDLTKGNGVLTANVDGQWSGFSFEWYKGNNSTGPNVYTGNTFSNASDGPYIVRALHAATGCSNENSISVSSQTQSPPVPQAKVSNHLTYCSQNNGGVSATVNGEVNGYTFFWYKGKNTNGTALEQQPNMGGLNTGFYTVRVRDNATGCISNAATVEVLNKRVDPKLEFEVGKASCGEKDGWVRVSVLSGEIPEKVEWIGPDGLPVRIPSPVDPGEDMDISKSVFITQIPAGEYKVRVFAKTGCYASGSVPVGASVVVYNAVSPNADFKNDFFEIACLQHFPNNNVKIFNRAGALVYEASRYDNEGVRFEGVSNKGLGSSGGYLPNGTYFYVINKDVNSNDDEILRGYLELLR
jgi:large repetitive protein